MYVQLAQFFEGGDVLPPDTVLGSQYLNPDYLFEGGTGFFNNIFQFLSSQGVVDIYKTILFVFTAFFLTIIFYSIIRIFEVRRKEKIHLRHEIEEYNLHIIEKEKKIAEGEMVSKNERWRQVLHLLFSTSQNDWKLAVIEADAMLEVLLGDLGFKGESLGDRLKTAGEQGFQSLSIAWEVHNIRNRIAHEGSTFEFSHHEAKRVISLYEKIFREFGYI